MPSTFQTGRLESTACDADTIRNYLVQFVITEKILLILYVKKKDACKRNAIRIGSVNTCCFRFVVNNIVANRIRRPSVIIFVPVVAYN
jgi:hypothetical protein